MKGNSSTIFETKESSGLDEALCICPASEIESKPDLRNSIPFNRRIMLFHSDEFPRIKKLAKDIKREFPAAPFTATRKDYLFNCLKNVLANLWLGWRMNKLVGVSLNKNHFTMSRRYGLGYYRYDLIKHVLNSLSSLSLVHIKKGFQDRATGKSFSTRVWASKKLKDSFGLLEDSLIYFVEYKEIIQLKNSKKYLISYQDTQRTNRMRDNLEKYNRLMDETYLSFSSEINNKHRGATITNTFQSCDKPRLENIGSNERILKDEYFNVASLNKNKTLYRVFNKNAWSCNGRFYGASYQQLPARLRKFILINNQKTVELDYGNLHLRMLYHMENVNYQKDGYSFISPELRKVVKQSILRMVNAGNRGKAIASINFQLMKDRDLRRTLEENDLTVKDVVLRIEKEHEPISKYFYTGIGNKLQNLDANLASKILNHFTRNNVPCLCIHDSFIIVAADKEKLEQQMIKHYKKVFGFNPTIEQKY